MDFFPPQVVQWPPHKATFAKWTALITWLCSEPLPTLRLCSVSSICRSYRTQEFLQMFFNSCIRTDRESACWNKLVLPLGGDEFFIFFWLHLNWFISQNCNQNVFLTSHESQIFQKPQWSRQEVARGGCSVSLTTSRVNKHSRVILIVFLIYGNIWNNLAISRIAKLCFFNNNGVQSCARIWDGNAGHVESTDLLGELQRKRKYSGSGICKGLLIKIYKINS